MGMITKDHSDIQQKNWIGKLPENLRPYAYLARADRPIGVWLLLIPGLWAIALSGHIPASSSFWPYILMVIFIIGSVTMRAAGCTINDLWDRNLDKGVARTRTRPLAAGDLSPPEALAFLGLLLFISFCLLIALPGTAILLGLLSLPFIVAYPLMKRITWWPQAFLGLTFNFSALIGWAAISDSLPLPAILLYVSCIFWTLGYDTIYARQDTEDDALMGIKSTALKFGDNAKLWVSGFYAAAFSLLFISVYSVIGVYAFCITPAATHLIWQILRWDLNTPASALSVFKSNRDYGLLVFSGIIAGNILYAL